VWCQDAGVALVTTQHGIYRVEHRDVHNGHGAAGASRPELFAEHSILVRGNRCVIEAGRINCDLVPTMECVETLLWSLDRVDGLGAAEARSESVAKAVSPSVGEGGETKHESKKECGG